MKVLVIAAHPDDEVLGVGGTIKKHGMNGDEVFLCILSSHAGARKIKPDQKELTNQIKRASKILGVRDIQQFDFPNIRMNTIPTIELVQAIEAAIIRFKPNIVYTHHGGDLNEDHRIIFSATMAAIRLPERNSQEGLPRTMIKEVLTYEVLSSTEWAAPIPSLAFTPNIFVDITDTIDKKIDALKEYPETLLTPPHPRSIETIHALATLRGSQAGLRYAEAFTLMRGIRS
jgi:N-acetylglucosamine malate deacetylase 1